MDQELQESIQKLLTFRTFAKWSLANQTPAKCIPYCDRVSRQKKRYTRFWISLFFLYTNDENKQPKRDYETQIPTDKVK
jgi:hypothetical protein